MSKPRVAGSFGVVDRLHDFLACEAAEAIMQADNTALSMVMHLGDLLSSARFAHECKPCECCGELTQSIDREGQPLCTTCQRELAEVGVG